MRSIILASFAFLLCWQPVLAQNPFAAAESPQQKKKKMQERFKSTPFNSLMSIPNVPDYPSAKGSSKFVRGLKYSALGQGDNCIVQTFLLKDPPDIVREWYQQTLANAGWIMQAANPKGTQILGRKRKEGTSVHVMVAPSPEKPWKCMVQVRYVQFQPLSDD